MTEKDSDEQTERDTSTDEAQNDAGESGQDSADRGDSTGDSGDNTDTSASGVVVEGYETNNAPREQTQALLEADSPDDVEGDLIKEIEEERKRRLDPENRPENTEVDNTTRVFVPAEAKFEDSDIDQDESLGQEGLAPVGGDKDPARDTGNDSDSDDDSSDDDSSDDDSSDDDSSDDDSSDDDSAEEDQDEESVDPQDDSEAITSGSPDPTDTGSGGKHKA